MTEKCIPNIKTHIEIQEIDNGFTIDFLADYPSPERLDQCIFVKTWKEAMIEIQKWHDEINKFIFEHEPEE
jgi:hypothetical protein